MEYLFIIILIMLAVGAVIHVRKKRKGEMNKRSGSGGKNFTINNTDKK